MGQGNTKKSSVNSKNMKKPAKTSASTGAARKAPAETPADKKPETIFKISVRNLVEFILRSGDITTSRSSLRDSDAMQEGTKIHQKLQKRMGSKYRSEVSLSTDFFVTATVPETHKDPFYFQITLEGRADGIFSDDNGIVIDEIKGVYKDIRTMKKPVPVHLAQAFCYAYIYARKEKLETIGVRMTYCHIPTERVRYFSEQKTFSELETWFSRLLSEYIKWCLWQLDHRKRRDFSIKAHDFPFPYRPGQKSLVEGVYLSILRKKRLYMEAPTGVGKTISTVFPAVKSIGEGLTEKIFYLTAKTITRTVAEETFTLLEKNQTLLKYVTITAKEKICILETPACHPDTCERAKGHFDRINDAMFDLLTQENKMDRACIMAYAEKHQVCPFELSLDLALWADVIIGDYNYAFDPNASLKRFFATEKENDFVFLIDEAHNLVERARDMYSASLVKEDFLSLKKMLKMKSRKLSSALESCSRAMLGLKRLCDKVQIYQTVETDALLLRLMRLQTLLEAVLQNADEPFDPEDPILFEPLSTKEKEILLNFYFEILNFLNIYELLNDHYIIYGELEEPEHFTLHLQCMDPSENLNAYLKKVRCSVFFSATLLPIHYYKEQLAFRDADYAIYTPSPFLEQNRLLLIGRGVSTKYSLRGPEMYQKIADYILKFIEGRTGNYLVFFPSYQMMNIIFEYLQISSEKAADKNFLLQSTYMSEEEREEFLSHFKENPDNTTVGLCVMGGIFGEGIDLKKERLIGAVLVGTGLPLVCTEKELFKNYFNKRNKDGFAYAYRFPGMNKVLQAAGRVIRTTEDKGAILLLDDRFLQADYQSLFPKEWFPYEVATINTIEEKLKNFWSSVR